MLPRFTALLTTQAERKPVMSTAYDAAVEADIVNNDKRKSVYVIIGEPGVSLD